MSPVFLHRTLSVLTNYSSGFCNNFSWLVDANAKENFDLAHDLPRPFRKLGIIIGVAAITNPVIRVIIATAKTKHAEGLASVRSPALKDQNFQIARTVRVSGGN